MEPDHLVGGYADNAVDVCGEGNTDAKRQCLIKGQTMMTQYPHIQCSTCPTPRDTGMFG